MVFMTLPCSGTCHFVADHKYIFGWDWIVRVMSFTAGRGVGRGGGGTPHLSAYLGAVNLEDITNGRSRVRISPWKGFFPRTHDARLQRPRHKSENDTTRKALGVRTQNSTKNTAQADGGLNLLRGRCNHI